MQQLNSCITSGYQLKHAEKAAKNTQAMDNELGLEWKMAEKTKEEWEKIITFSNDNDIDTHVYEGYIKRLLQNQTVNKKGLTHLDDLIKRITKDGFKA